MIEPGTVVGKHLWDPELRQWERTPGSYGMTRHPFTRIQITDKGLMLQVDISGTKYWKNKKLN